MYYFRMVEPDFSPLPVYEAMREYTTNLIPTLYPGVHQENHWALEYKGDWETIQIGGPALADYRQSHTPGDTVHFSFEGSSLELMPGPGAGEIKVSVDGEEPQHISLAGEPVRLMHSWQSERHEIALTAVSGAVSVDALAVQRPWRPSLWLALGAVALAIAAVWSMYRLLRRR